MLDKDKLIIVCYVACGDMSKYKAAMVLSEIKHMLISTFDDSVKVIVIPQLHSYETRLEFINTNNETLNEDKLSQFGLAAQNLQTNINKFVDFE